MLPQKKPHWAAGAKFPARTEQNDYKNKEKDCAEVDEHPAKASYSKSTLTAKKD